MIRCALVLTLTACAGCAFGPKAIERTHGQYASAVQKVDEEQFLRNIVRLRYLESPRDLEVSAIAAQYELAAGAEARPFFSTESVSGPFFRGFSRLLPYASISGSNRPTVSFNPQDDGSTVRQFLTPISPETLVFLTQSGWPVSSVLRIWADRLNGVPNAIPAGGPPRNVLPDFARFDRACELLQVSQDREYVSILAEDRTTEMSGAIPAEAMTAVAAVEAAKGGFEYRKREDGKTWSLVKVDRRLVFVLSPAGKASPEMTELVEILNLKPDADKYELVVASGVPDPAKHPLPQAAVLRLSPRSTAQALFFLANGVEVPPEDIACGLVRMPGDGSDPTEATRGVFRVHSCAGSKHCRPACASVAIWHRDRWFYIDDRDHDTKATLLLMLQLRRLDFKKQQVGAVPALTLTVGR